MAALHGIDVSDAKGDIDWTAVHVNQPSLQFVMSRMTHGGHGDDNLRVDKKAARNKAGMRAAFYNAARGYYHFLGTGTPSVQAAHFARIVGALQDDEFVMLDVEPDEPAKVPVLPVSHILATLEAIEREFGITPMLYIGLYYPGAGDPRLARFPHIIPGYIGEVSFYKLVAQQRRRLIAWQWGGGTNGAQVPGIPGRVDSNRIEDLAGFRRCLMGAATGAATGAIDQDASTGADSTSPTTTSPAPAPALDDITRIIITNGDTDMGYIAANADDRSNPTRWYVTALAKRKITDEQEVERMKRHGLLPATFSLGNPNDPALEWMGTAQLNSYATI